MREHRKAPYIALDGETKNGAGAGEKVNCAVEAAVQKCNVELMQSATAKECRDIISQLQQLAVNPEMLVATRISNRLINTRHRFREDDAVQEATGKVLHHWRNMMRYRNSEIDQVRKQRDEQKRDDACRK